MAKVRKLSVSELQKIISLHEYNNIEEMLAENKRSIKEIDTSTIYI